MSQCLYLCSSAEIVAPKAVNKDHTFQVILSYSFFFLLNSGFISVLNRIWLSWISSHVSRG